MAKGICSPGPTIERLQSLLLYDPESGLFFWRERRNGFVRAGQISGYKNAGGYFLIRIDRRDYVAHRLAWLYMTNEWPLNEIDHKDGNPTNNKWENLRVATRSQNQANSKRNSLNTSGFKGVSFHKGNGRWVAYVSRHGHRHNLGSFSKPEEAHKAYVRASNELFGEFARPA